MFVIGQIDCKKDNAETYVEMFFVFQREQNLLVRDDSISMSVSCFSYTTNSILKRCTSSRLTKPALH